MLGHLRVILDPSKNRALAYTGVTVCKNNWMTLADLLFWARCEAISYHSNVLAIPKEMKFTSRSDRQAFSTLLNTNVEHHNIRKRMFFAGAFMNLGDCYLTAHRRETHLVEDLVKR